ncbi:hypothetical protein ES332_D13G197000v1 [Gossypium tomentosum]|uniref:Uncharacterized protein n=1 Tax=Gossypium tomentosum TaxID=34277 RepID=A0A5D2HZF2_GOSTO|nr:hypothetical protein ES332_D13G197000v1 [Gossypium tomentosum]
MDNPPSQEEKSFIIFKVPHRLREVNEKAYEPNVISIGPYHYCKPHLVRMEDTKKRWFEKIARETNLGLNEFREKMKLLEGKTRKCYEQPLPPGLEAKANFVDMMVYDGCFVVQLLQNSHRNDLIGNHGPNVLSEMQYDLLLLENQLPFFVLLELYRMITPTLEPERRICKLVAFALNFFERRALYLPESTSIRHLLHLVHTTFHPSHLGAQAEEEKKVACCFPKNTIIGNLLHLVHTTFHRSPPGIQPEVPKKEEHLQSSRNCMPSTTELEDAGIDSVSIQGEKNKFDITFDNATKELKIPTLEVDDSTEREFRNYMVYEQFFPSDEPTYFVDYVVFMDDLINTCKDVELLRKSRIIDNWLGNDEAVTNMFNKLGDCIYYSRECFYYKNIVIQVNKHCETKCNIWKWKAKLMKDYFNTPWSPISFLAAFVLLVLTIVQTIFSLLSYYH